MLLISAHCTLCGFVIVLSFHSLCASYHKESGLARQHIRRLYDMQDMSMENKLKQVGKAFNIAGDFISFEEIKVGNVNRTYRVNYVRDEDGKPLEKSYIVQKINTYAFK